MDFTFLGYEKLLKLLRDMGYCFAEYQNYSQYPRAVILRHDIDFSLEAALNMARLEAEHGVVSTYFVLLTSDLYNVASPKSLRMLREIQRLGHTIGVHFDETAYASTDKESMVQNILKECRLLSALLETSWSPGVQLVSRVSMHRPSAQIFHANLQIPGVINAYEVRFIQDFKYLSDSRRRWREPAFDIIRSGTYDRLHILTHAFWYNAKEENISDSIKKFVSAANRERYQHVAENISDIASILREDEI